MALLIYGSLALCVGAVLASQHSPYSLQSAVDALHRREAQLALRDEVTGEPLDEEGYWMEPSDDPQLPSFRPNRQRLNKLLANYLRRDEDPDEGPYDPYELEARKRSMFRERDALADLPSYPTTVFREREMEKPYRPDLSADFLKEIDRQANLEREEKYLDQLRDLWDKYQQQENEIEQELFDEERAAAAVGEEPNPFYEKRQGYPTVSQSEAAAMYYGPPMEERKRQMPMLPWLPASRKKRFPVAKRSPKPESTASGTDEKVAKDLQALFGAPEEKKKRSSDQPELEKKQDKQNDTKTHEKRDASGEEHEEHSSEEHEDEEHDHEHDHDHDHEHEESSEEHEGEDDDKKKRSVKKRSNLEVVKEDQILPGDIGEFKAKKSIQWNKYFGMDRRKKSGRDSGVYPLSFYKNYDEDRKKKNSLNRDKLDNMDRKLKTIEDLILDQTVKYTGDHEGGLIEPVELQKLKDKVVSRLATAYSIEKMRRTLDKLKDSVGDELDPRNNEIDSEKRDDKKEKAKRVAIKKEKAEFDHSQHSLEPSAKTAQEEVENDLEELDEDKKKKKKKRVTKRFQDMYPKGLPDFEDELGAGHYAPIGEGYGQSLAVETNECPLLDALERRCRGVDVLSGDIYQDLLPACGAHQLCYLCGTSQTDCDFQYLLEADTLCEKQASCQTAARSALTILRGFPGPQLGPRECAKNPCLYRAMVEVGVSGL